MNAPVIIEVAVNGLCKKGRNPHVPETVAEIIEDGTGCIEAGASIIHAHASSYELEADEAYRQYADIFAGIRRRCPAAHLYPSAIGGASLAERVAHFPRLVDAGLIGMGYMDPGSVNILAELDDSGLPKGGFPYVNSFEHCNEQIAWFNREGIAPSLAVFEPGFLHLILTYYRAGVLPVGSLIKFYFGGDYSVVSGAPTVPHGLPPTPASLDALLAMMGDCPVPWAVSVIGGDLTQSSVLPYALERGGHVRVGLEDYAGARVPTNLELVEEVLEIIAATGRRPATPQETAAILGIRKRQE